MDDWSQEELLRYLRELIKICEELEMDKLDVSEAPKRADALVPSPSMDLKDYVDLLVNVIDWKGVFEGVVKAFKTGFQVNYANFMKSPHGWNYKVSYKGARAAVKELSGFSPGPLTNITTVLKRSLKYRFSRKEFFPGMSFLIGPSVTFIFSAIDLVFRVITFIKFFSNFLGALLFEVIKLAVDALIKGVLAPFLGPFAWIVAWVGGITMDLLNAWLDIEGMLSVVINNILEYAWGQIAEITQQIINIGVGG